MSETCWKQQKTKEEQEEEEEEKEIPFVVSLMTHAGLNRDQAQLAEIISS